ncbi:MAG TPA: hypothetical protein VJ921_08560 [Vicinamibacteria bacterium]|nr:hypothetical protein [Vicinamibacteria bacterium]
MRSSRFRYVPLLVAAVIVLAGVAYAAAAYLSVEGVSARSSSSGPSLEFVPEGAALVGYVDFQAVASSPLADTWSDALRDEERLGALEEIEESTSIDILNDVDSLTLAVGPGTGKPERWGIAARGVFDRERLLEKLSLGKDVVETANHSGTDVYTIKNGRNGGNGAQTTAMAQPDDSILLFGEPGYVRDMLDAGAGRKPSATAILSTWSYGGFEEETFWFAGKAPGFVEGLVGRSGDAATLRSFALTGRLESEMRLRARGEAIDAAKARELADVVRGLIAFGRLQQQGAELGKILESISVDLVDDQIDVSLLVSYESIRELIQQKGKASSAAQ